MSLDQAPREKDAIVRGLHLLLARFHLDLAGKRLLTQEEFSLGVDIADWWLRR